MPSFGCFVFDFDGTLIDSNQLKMSAFFELAAEIDGGSEAMMKVQLDQVGDRFMAWEAWAKALGRSQEYGQMMAMRYSERVDELVISAPEMLGARALLDYLHFSNKRMVLSSATPYTSLVHIIQRRGLDKYFSDVFGSPMTKLDVLVNKVIPTVGHPDLVAVIGDGPDDRDSAIRAKCHFFPVGERGRATGKENTPTYSLPQLKALFQVPR